MSARRPNWFLAIGTLAAVGLASLGVTLLRPLSLRADEPPSGDRFLPLTAGTFWRYQGTVQWGDPESDKTQSADVTITTKVERVIEKPEYTLAVISGYPSDLDWATGEVEPKPSLLIETRKHEVFVNSLPPDFNFDKLQDGTAALDKILSDDNLLFRWPLKAGMKYGDPESIKRDDDMYCWQVVEQHSKSLPEIKGLTAATREVFLLRYATNPDDTQIELLPGIGILGYEYHHHGTTADTNLRLVEFHAGSPTAAAAAARP